MAKTGGSPAGSTVDRPAESEGSAPTVGSSPDWQPARLPGPLIFASVAAVYAGLSQFVMWLNDPVHLGAGFWPAAGVTTAVLLLLPGRRWGWVIAGVAVAEAVGDLVLGYPLAATLLWTAGNTLGPFVGAMLVRRFVHPTGALVPLGNLIGFVVLGVLAGSFVGASVGTIGSVASIGNPFWQVWPKYVVGDALGVLVIAPLLLTWKEGRPPRCHAESVTLLALVLVVPALTFRNWNGAWDIALPHLVTPLLTWVALRYGVRVTAWVVMWVAQVANWATAAGYGPFALTGGPTGHAITLLQVFLTITTITALIVAVLVTDLRRRSEAERELERQAERLRQAVEREATAVQVHDKVVQLLSTVSLALHLDDRRTAIEATQAATQEAQRIVSELLTDMEVTRGGVMPGDLIAGRDIDTSDEARS